MNTQTFTSRLSSLSSSRKEGLTSIFRKAQERVSSSTTTWLNPEVSIGRYIGKVGRDHAWEANGPARDAFNHLAPSIKAYLEAAVEPISSRVIWSMYMIGKAPCSAAPFIIFCCEVLEHRRNVRNTIKDSGILNGYPGIKTGHLSRPPDFNQLVPLANGDASEDDFGNFSMLTSYFKSACGSQLFLNGDDPETCSAKATIGGVIRLDDECYYTTVAHALQSSPGLLTASETLLCEVGYTIDDDDVFSLDGSEIADNATSYSGEEVSTTSSFSYEKSPWTVCGKRSQHLEDPAEGSKEYNPGGNPYAANALPELADVSLSTIGRPFMTSLDSGPQAAGLDYALIQVSSPDHVLENVIRVGTDDQSVVRIQCVVRSEPQDVEILAATSRGVIRGYISGTPSYSCPPGHNSFNKMFKVCLDGPLHRGDCGTWVIDARCGDLYGHIVIGSPGDGVALVAPFPDIFEDIHGRLGQSPSFPTARNGTVLNRTNESRMRTQLQVENSTTVGQSEDLSNQCVASNTTVSGPPETVETLVAAYKNEDEQEMPHTALVESGPSHEGSSETWAKDLSIEFGRMMELRNRFKRELDESASPDDSNEDDARDALDPRDRNNLAKSSPRTQPPDYSSLQDLPRVPKAPESGDREAQKFRNLLSALSEHPIKWENNGLLDEALQDLALEQIYREAEEETSILQAQADSMGDGRGPEWGYQDCVIQALMRYFKRSFFQWINSPPCDFCGSTPTVVVGKTAPTGEEQAKGALIVESYQCSRAECVGHTRFPRYSDVWTLMTTRRGRSGEWANCFGMLCRAFGSRVRLVWNAEDHVWTEVYSEHQKRWVHLDACEETWDNPLVYAQGFGKKMSYCIAFSADGVADVTRRYVRSPEDALPRTRCPEEVLLYIVQELRTKRRKDMSKDDRSRLEQEDATEARELQSYIVASLTSEVSRLSTAGKPSSSETLVPVKRSGLRRSDSVKRLAAEETRASGAGWLSARVESRQPGPDNGSGQE